MDFIFLFFFLQHPLLSGRPFSYQHVGGSLLSRNYSRTIVPPKNFSRFLTTAQSSTSNPSPERTGNNFHTSVVYAYQVLSETSGVPTPSVQSCLTVNGHDKKKVICVYFVVISFLFFYPCLFQLSYNLICIVLFARYADIADVVALLYSKKMKLLKKIILFILVCHGKERVMSKKNE